MSGPARAVGKRAGMQKEELLLAAGVEPHAALLSVVQF